MAGWEMQHLLNHGEENSALCRPEPPFWWMGPNTAVTARPEPSAYDSAVKLQNVEKIDVLKEMKLNDAGEYLPSEVFYNRKVPLQVGQGQKYGATVQWTPKSPEFNEPFDPNSVPQSNWYLYNQVKRRQIMDLGSTLREDSEYNSKDGNTGLTPAAPEKPGADHPVNEYTPASLTPSQRIVEATNAHITGTNPCCFRDVIGRN